MRQAGFDFDVAARTPPAQRHSPTSRAAAESAKAFAKTARAQVLAYLRGAGTYGATDEEIQDGLPMNASTERPRRIELVELGEAKDSGTTRPTRSGKAATVWVATG